MTYKGTILYIGEPKAVTEKFTVREFVVTDSSDKYPQEIKFQVTNKNCPFLDAYNVGDVVEIAFNLRGRRYERDGNVTWYNTIEAWKISKVSANPTGDRDYSDAFNQDVPF